MKAALILALLLLPACASKPGDFTADQLDALGPLLKGERP